MKNVERMYLELARFSAVMVILLGLYVLFFKHIKKLLFDLGRLPMAYDSGVCFLIIGIVLLLQLSNKKSLKALSAILAFTVFGYSAMLLPDMLLQQPLLYKIHSGMAPQTALCFLLISAALMLRLSHKLYFKKASAYAFNIVTIVAVVVALGYLISVPELYSFSFVPMSAYAAFGFILFSTSASLLNPTVGLTSVFTGRKIGNIMARRIFMQLIISIIVLGYLHVLDHRYHWFSHEFSAALQTIILIFVGLFIIWETSEKLNKAQADKDMVQENFKIAVDSAPYALVISNADGKIILANHQTELLYGYKKRELIGQPVKLLLPKIMHNDYEARKISFFRKQVTVYFTGTDDDEMLITADKDGKEFPVEMVFIPIKTESEVLCLTSIIDITERKQYEDIIKQQVTELQFKNQELEQFNYIASHDLQEPLRTVSNYIQLLEEDYPEQVTDEIKVHLCAMDAAIVGMSTLVKSLLIFGKLGRNKKMTLIDCSELVENVLSDLSSLISSKNAVIKIEGKLPILNGYETELRLLFQNLINNAIKFTAPGTAPFVTISCREDKGFYSFYIADNGIGIDPQYNEKIFHIFQRLNKAEDYEGHGIGLAHCKKITEMHGGRIWAEPRPGGGTVFTFTILNLKNYETA
ncbi:ATP-binding protein [Flavobacterium coralii]|uniref:sensor histidine kinase n=1 Tax=Flavobacterium coralii TaxID=2838017 RepID=UPI000C521399|nr:hypothetical protein [Flavobacterium sp.]